MTNPVARAVSGAVSSHSRREITQVGRDRDGPTYRFAFRGGKFPGLGRRVIDLTDNDVKAGAPQTSAMPDPIRPRPMTPTLAMSLNRLPFRRCGVGGADLEARPD